MAIMNIVPYQVPGLRHVISQAATGYIDPATGHMQPHRQGQVYHEPHHLHHQVSHCALKMYYHLMGISC